jgi:hypothetical protein
MRVRDNLLGVLNGATCKSFHGLKTYRIRIVTNRFSDEGLLEKKHDGSEGYTEHGESSPNR